MSDHIHACISIPLKYSVANAIGFLKGKSAIRLHREFGSLRKGKHFWIRGYNVSTVGLYEYFFIQVFAEFHYPFLVTGWAKWRRLHENANKNSWSSFFRYRHLYNLGLVLQCAGLRGLRCRVCGISPLKVVSDDQGKMDRQMVGLSGAFLQAQRWRSPP